MYVWERIEGNDHHILARFFTFIFNFNNIIELECYMGTDRREERSNIIDFQQCSPLGSQYIDNYNL